MQDLRSVLQKHGFAFKKQFGQNFISDTNLLDSIVENSGIDKFINEQIDKESQEIIYYKYLGYSSKEISNLTNLSLKQIYNRMNKAKNILKTGGYH